LNSIGNDCKIPKSKSIYEIVQIRTKIEETTKGYICDIQKRFLYVLQAAWTCMFMVNKAGIL
jgi:hypothetical protein